MFITNALQDKELPIYGDGQQIRHWIYVMDHCEALLQVAEKGVLGQVYNIGGPESSELSNLKVTKSILKELDKPASLMKTVAVSYTHLTLPTNREV